MNGGIPERKWTVKTSMCASLNRPRSFVREICGSETDRRGHERSHIAKYSVDPALTDIRGELSVEDAEANLGGNAGCRSLNRERQPFLFLWAENFVFIRDLGAAKCQRYGD